MEPEGSLPYSHKPTTGPYPKHLQSSSLPYTCVFKLLFNIILQFTSSLSYRLFECSGANVEHIYLHHSYYVLYPPNFLNFNHSNNML
jgi:hypothetical protein